ncbi:pilin, partial [Patescibacteria group bacterium]|nr:pilin [Patescibacteria group bacterium]
DGAADCKIEISANSEADCTKYDNDPEAMASALGLSSSALNFVNVSGYCLYDESGSGGITIQDVQQQAQETSAGTAQAAPTVGSGGSLVGTTGIQSVGCEETGDCTIEQIIQKGVYFAQFIMGLSGALFLIVFIYGGALYILSFGRSEWVNKGQKAMVQAAIGIVFVMGAWTIVWYVAQSLGYTG